MSLTKVSYSMITGAPVNVLDFGADSTGVSDSSAAIQAAFDAGNRIYFPDGTYRLATQILVAKDDIEIDFGNATIINEADEGTAYGGLFSFNLGAGYSNTPTYQNIKITGGYFTQGDPAGTGTGYIYIVNTRGVYVANCVMENINRGVWLDMCQDGVIDNIVVKGANAGSGLEAIYLNGARATDYASQLVNLATLERNATAVPVYGTKNISVTNCSISLDGYGVYLVNAHNCRVENNYIAIPNSGRRCITINNYSPGAIVKGNTLVGDQTATGIRVTQYSQNVIIEGNTFRGTFDGGRDIFVVDLAEALITGNYFYTTSSVNVEIANNGLAIVQNNYSDALTYQANAAFVLNRTIDPGSAANTGDSATTLRGCVVQGNTIRFRPNPVYVLTSASTGGNVPGLKHVVCANNTFLDQGTASATREYGMYITALGTTYGVEYSYYDNGFYPTDYAFRNIAYINDVGTTTPVRTDFQSATFQIQNVGSGAVTSTKLFGGNFSCTATRNADTLVLTPKTLGGASGASIAFVNAVSDISGNAATWRAVKSGSTYVLRLYDTSGAQIALSTTNATVAVTVSYNATN